MRKAFFLIAALVVLLGCLQLPKPEEDLSGFKDCREDTLCIFEAAKAGERAFATVKQEGEEAPFGLTAKIVAYGFEQGKIKIKFKVESIEAKAGKEEAAMASVLAPLIQGQEMLCLVPRERFSDAATIQFDEIQENCSGSLVEVMKQFKGQQ